MGEFEPDVFKDPGECGFKQIKVFDIGDIVSTTERIHFLDSCSRFGNVFVGRQSGFDLYRQADLEGTGGDAPKATCSVSLAGQLRWLAVSSCGLTLLATVLATDNTTENLFFDTRSLLKGDSAPFAKQTPPPTHETIISACWNPSIAEILTIVYQTGAVQVLKVEKSVSVHATKAPFNARCIAWSPKGKQMVIGKGPGPTDIEQSYMI